MARIIKHKNLQAPCIFSLRLCHGHLQWMHVLKFQMLRGKGSGARLFPARSSGSRLRAEGSSPAVNYLWLLFHTDLISEKPDSWWRRLSNVDRLVIYSCWTGSGSWWSFLGELNWIVHMSQYEVIYFIVGLVASWFLRQVGKSLKY